MRAALFPAAEVGELDYEVAAHGDGRWNGVALLSGSASKTSAGVSPANRVMKVSSCAGPDRRSRPTPAEARAVGAPPADTGLVAVCAERAHTRLAPLCLQARLVRGAAGRARRRADHQPQLAACGDFNVAPTDDDVWDPAVLIGSTHVTPAKRRRAGRPAGARPAGRRAHPDEGTAPVHLLGLPARHVREEQRHAD